MIDEDIKLFANMPGKDDELIGERIDVSSEMRETARTVKFFPP